MRHLEDKIEALRGFKKNIPRLKEEIEAKIHAIESGFSLLEKETAEEELDNIIEYYKGIVKEGVR
jgi:hypothetical protein